MGTNFYAEKRGRTLHVGKRFGAGGGLLGFIFQAHHLPDGDLDSWAKWRNVLLATRTFVYDEYRGTHDVDAFIAMIENITPENRRRQLDLVIEQGCPTTTYDDPDKGTSDYLCPDGFCFTYQEFT